MPTERPTQEKMNSHLLPQFSRASSPPSVSASEKAEITENLYFLFAYNTYFPFSVRGRGVSIVRVKN